MINPDQEKQLVIIAVGVVIFTIVAIVSFIAGLNSIIFYIFAVLAIVLGFYLSYVLSRDRDQPAAAQQSKKKK